MPLYRFLITEDNKEACETAVLNLANDTAAAREMRFALIDLASEIADGCAKKAFTVSVRDDTDRLIHQATMDIAFSETQTPAAD
jgi:ribosomal protein S7